MWHLSPEQAPTHDEETLANRAIALQGEHAYRTEPTFHRMVNAMGYMGWVEHTFPSLWRRTIEAELRGAELGDRIGWQANQIILQESDRIVDYFFKMVSGKVQQILQMQQGEDHLKEHCTDIVEQAGAEMRRVLLQSMPLRSLHQGNVYNEELVAIRVYCIVDSICARTTANVLNRVEMEQIA